MESTHSTSRGALRFLSYASTEYPDMLLFRDGSLSRTQKQGAATHWMPRLLPQWKELCRSFLPCRRSFPRSPWSLSSEWLLCRAASLPTDLERRFGTSQAAGLQPEAKRRTAHLTRQTVPSNTPNPSTAAPRSTHTALTPLCNGWGVADTH